MQYLLCMCDILIQSPVSGKNILWLRIYYRGSMWTLAHTCPQDFIVLWGPIAQYACSCNHRHVHIPVYVYTLCTDVYHGHLCAWVCAQRYLHTYGDIHTSISVYPLPWFSFLGFFFTFTVLYVSTFLESLNNFLISEIFIPLMFVSYSYYCLWWLFLGLLREISKCTMLNVFSTFLSLLLGSQRSLRLLCCLCEHCQRCSLLNDLLQPFLLPWNSGLSVLFVCFVLRVGDGSRVVHHQAVFSLTLMEIVLFNVWFSGFSFNNFIFIMKMAHFVSIFLPVWKSSR